MYSWLAVIVQRPEDSSMNLSPPNRRTPRRRKGYGVILVNSNIQESRLVRPAARVAAFRVRAMCASALRS